MLQAQAITEFSEAQHQLINYLSTFVLGEAAIAEFSAGQDLLIDMLAGMLADPNYLLYWSFEVWAANKLNPEFMELLSGAYLKLSELNPPPERESNAPLNEEDAFKRLQLQQQQANQNPYLQQTQPTQTSPLMEQAQPLQQIQSFQRPTVPAPPVPASNGAANGWGGIRQAMQSGNSLQALREVGKLSPQDWREMFNN